MNCYDKLWNDAGCISERKNNQQPVDYWNKLSLKDLKKSVDIYKNSPLETYRKGCYGDDKSKWQDPCAGAGDNDMINEYCQDKIWQDNGCPKSRYSNDNIPWHLNNTTLKEMKDVAKNYKNNPDEYHRKGCYGNDKSKWPVVPNNPVETSHCYNLDSQGLNDCVYQTYGKKINVHKM